MTKGKIIARNLVNSVAFLLDNNKFILNAGLLKKFDKTCKLY